MYLFPAPEIRIVIFNFNFHKCCKIKAFKNEMKDLSIYHAGLSIFFYIFSVFIGWQDFCVVYLGVLNKGKQINIALNNCCNWIAKCCFSSTLTATHKQTLTIWKGNCFFTMTCFSLQTELMYICVSERVGVCVNKISGPIWRLQFQRPRKVRFMKND